MKFSHSQYLFILSKTVNIIVNITMHIPNFFIYYSSIFLNSSPRLPPIPVANLNSILGPSEAPAPSPPIKKDPFNRTFISPIFRFIAPLYSNIDAPIDAVKDESFKPKAVSHVKELAPPDKLIPKFDFVPPRILRTPSAFTTPISAFKLN